MAMDPPTVTHQEKKITVGKDGKPHLYEPSGVKAARAKLEANLARYRPEKPYDCGVRLIVKWMFWSKTEKPGTYRITKPDTDNLQKLLKDCMTRCGFWKDDALVASEIVEKFWNDIPGIWIRIEVLHGADKRTV